MTDHRLQRRLEEAATRGEPRGAASVFLAAEARGLEMSDSPDGGSPPPDGHRGRARLVAAAALLVLVAASVWAVRAGRDGTTTQVSADRESDLCRALASPLVDSAWDVHLYLHPDATPDDVDAMEVLLRGLPDLAELRYVDREETVAQFEELFADDPGMVRSVDPSDLPTSFTLRFDPFDGRAKAAVRDALNDEGRLDDRVYDVEFRPLVEARLLDVVVEVATSGQPVDPVAGPGTWSPLFAVAPLESLLRTDLDPQVRADLERVLRRIRAGGSTVSPEERADLVDSARRLLRVAESDCGLTVDPSGGAASESTIATFDPATSAPVTTGG